MITLFIVGALFSIIGSILILTGKAVWFLTVGILKFLCYLWGAIFVLILLICFLV